MLDEQEVPSAWTLSLGDTRMGSLLELDLETFACKLFFTAAGQCHRRAKTLERLTAASDPPLAIVKLWGNHDLERYDTRDNE